MHTKSGKHRVEIREKARGGEGELEFHHLLEKEQLGPHSRLLGRIVMRPGNSMGLHTHHDEGEFFYILSGVAKITQDGEEVLLYPGDTIYTPPESDHSVETGSDETLEYLALILSTA